MVLYKKVNQWEMNTYGRKIYRVPSWVDWIQPLFYNNITEAEVRVHSVSFSPLLVSVEEISSSLHWFSLFLLPLLFGVWLFLIFGALSWSPQGTTLFLPASNTRLPLLQIGMTSRGGRLMAMLMKAAFHRVWTLQSGAPGAGLGRGEGGREPSELGPSLDVMATGNESSPFLGDPGAVACWKYHTW